MFRIVVLVIGMRPPNMGYGRRGYLIRCMLRSEAEPADGAYESMFRPEMLERERQRHREGIRRKVSTDVRASDEPKESTHEGHVKDP